MKTQLSFYGRWPMLPSKRWEGELALTCPKCGSQDASILTRPGAFGTGPNGRWRMGDRGGAEVAVCGGCGNEGQHTGIPRVKDLALGTRLILSSCRCVYEIVDREGSMASGFVVLRRVEECGLSYCDKSSGEEFLLGVNEPIAGSPGRASLLLYGDG